MAEHFGRVWEVEQDQPTNHRIERPHVAEDSNVGLHEMNVAGTGSDSALLGDGEERSGLIDPDDLTRCADELAEKKRHMAQAGAQIEHPHPGRDTGAAQEGAVGAAMRAAWASNRASSASDAPSE